MLTELYQYAQEKSLAARPGFKLKQLKAYVELSAQGDLLGIQVQDKNTVVYAPDIGSKANSGQRCNFLVEKAKVPLGLVEDPKKDQNIPTMQAFYLEMLEAGAQAEPMFAVVLQVLKDTEKCAAIADALKKNKIKPNDAIGFRVDGHAVERSERYLSWWQEYRQRFRTGGDGVLPRCLITGELATALKTVPKVSGLNSVGGHTSGDAFLCFDKDAFQSYGLKQSANAPVSEGAMTAVNAALTKLIQQAPVFGNAKLVHWYAGPISDEDDLLPVLLDPGWTGEDSEEAGPETEDLRQAETAAMGQAGQLMSSVSAGERPERPDARFYIMPLSGAGGRMMVRGWYEGDYETLYQNVQLWFDDLLLIRPDGKGLCRPPKLQALCFRLLKPGGDPKKTYSRLNEELPNLLGRVFAAIVNGTPLPDEVAQRTLHWIRSSMVSTKEANGRTVSTIQRETLSFQLLKAWLRRVQRQKGEKNQMGENCNESPHTVAYCCGQLMAVYSAIQQAAMPNVNVAVTERYYTAASTTPAFVLGRLSQMAQHYFPKLNPKLAIYYQKILGSIYLEIGENSIPNTLDLRQQTEFAIGYYQRRADLYKPKEEQGGNDNGDQQQI